MTLSPEYEARRRVVLTRLRIQNGWTANEVATLAGSIDWTPDTVEAWELIFTDPLIGAVADKMRKDIR